MGPPSDDEDLLPALREDLSIEETAPDVSGATQWRLFDPVRQRFFMLSQEAVTVLSLWGCGSAKRLSALLAEQGVPDPVEAILDLRQFLLDEQLATPLSRADQALVASRLQARQSQGLVQWLALYLAWRKPLFRPQAFLVRTLPSLLTMVQPVMLLLWGFLTLFGLYMVSRQWDAFTHDILDLISWQGLVSYALAASVLKVLHELGHAYTAVHAGARVSSMGVMVSMGVPMLYTDTTDVARLPDARARMRVAMAGVAAEVWLAGLALLLWALVPQGAVRGVAMVLATSSLATSLIINLNPLSKFDGYHALSDALGMENLQARSQALMMWWLRKVFLGWREPPPEAVRPQQGRAMVAYGALCWLYRLSTYFAMAGAAWFLGQWGIATAILLGAFFLVLWRPWHQWRRTLAKAPSQAACPSGMQGKPGPLGLRWNLLSSLVVVAVFLALVPLDRRAEAEGLLRSSQEATLRSVEPAQVESINVQAGQWVRQGEVLMTLKAPELTLRRMQAQLQLRMLRERLARVVADARDREELQIIEQSIEQSAAELSGLDLREQALVIVAPHAGRVRDLALQLQPGAWVRPDAVLCRVVGQASLDATAYLPGKDVPRVQPLAKARFIPEDPAMPALPMRVQEVQSQASEQIQPAWLAQAQGGPISTRADDKGRQVPLASSHQMVLRVDPTWQGSLPTTEQVRGHVVIEAQPQSLAIMGMRHVWRVLITQLGQ
jgi:putative peptide zinc metalloprotease protein